VAAPEKPMRHAVYILGGLIGLVLAIQLALVASAGTVVTVLLLAGMLAVQAIGVGWSASSIRYLLTRWDRSSMADWIFLVLRLEGWTSMVVTLFSFGLGWFTALLNQYVARSLVPFQIRTFTGSAVLDGILFYAIYNFCDYWKHRFWHTRIGWFGHRFHHSATHFSPLLAFRFHPLETGLEPLFVMWPAAFLGFHPRAIAIAMLVGFFLSMFVHLDVNSDWGWFGRWVIISPRDHKIHHSPLPEHADKNFAVMVLWDRVFGTWYGGTVRNTEVGIVEPVHNRRPVWRELLADSWGFFGEIGRGFRQTITKTVERAVEPAPPPVAGTK
jgi:sterol desaturase/sphingolipid hydroxylase (fatty acid hydroxylase superfamily)